MMTMSLREKRSDIGSRKEKNMTTMNRIYCLYSESCKRAHLDERELGFSFMHSSIDKHIRGNCVTDTGRQ